jgi:Flp pilus assembly protein TadD
MRFAGRPPVLFVILSAAGLIVSGCTETGPLANLESRPTNPAVAAQAPGNGGYLALGKRYLSIDEPELAYDAFVASMRTEGLTAEALTGAGIASEKQGLLTEARRFFDRALTLDPESLAANNNLGVVLFRLKEYYPAREAFRAAFALSSGQNEIAERNLNRVEVVVAQIEEAEKSDPAVSYRVVRLGTSEFRITPAPEESPELIQAN